MARAHGVTGYSVLYVDRARVDVVIHGDRDGRLRAVVEGGVATQELEFGKGEGRVLLRSSTARIEAFVDGRRRVLAERAGARWRVVERPDAAMIEGIRMIVAIDVDFAVQGSSLVFDAGAYVECTAECETAAACDVPASSERCASSLVTCGACLEQEP